MGFSPVMAGFARGVQRKDGGRVSVGHWQGRAGLTEEFGELLRGGGVGSVGGSVESAGS